MGSLNNQHDKPQSSRHLFKKSLLAICVVAAGAPAFAQTDSSDQIEEVVVTGMRQSLQNAQDIKRNSSTFVDSVTASDIGALPDRSVLEAMQRIPGVSIERFAAVDDPDHMSAEGSGAVIRGMTATRSEFNGRDSFTANSGRGLSFQDVSPEMMAGVDVYKNQTADMIEGGIGGTVSLRTRKPFDQTDRMIAVSAEATYGDLSEETKPTFSALFSDRWETSAGEFGFLINAVKSEMTTENHNIQSDAYKRYYPCWLDGAEDFAKGTGCPGMGTDAIDYETYGEVWMPSAMNFLVKEDQRTREGINTSFQWKDNDDKFLVTTEYIRSKSTLDWWEDAMKYQGGYKDSDRRIRPYGDSSFVFDDQGRFLSGSMSDGDGRWFTNHGPYTLAADGKTKIWDEPRGLRYPMTWGNSNPVSLPEFGQKFQLDTRGVTGETLVEDFSGNVKWTPDDLWTVELDLQHVKAETTNDDLVLHLAVAGLQDVDLRGDTPSLHLSEPWGGVRDANRDAWIAAYPNGVPGFSNDPQGDANYFTDPTSYWWRSGMSHYERSEGDSNAVRLDISRKFEDAGALREVKAGVRWAEREQTVRSTSWGWGSIAPEFSEGALFIDHTPDQASWVQVNDWSNFHRGGVMTIDGGNQLLGIKRDVVANIRDNRLCEGDVGFPVLSENGSYEPYHCRENNDSKYGLFQPFEVAVTTETNKAAFVRVDFGFDDLKYPIAGNIGMRYVQLDRESTGFTRTAEVDKDYNPDTMSPPAGVTLPLTGDKVKAYMNAKITDGTYADASKFMEENGNWVNQGYNWLSDSDRKFGDSGSGWQTANQDYDAWLPSLNLKMELSDDLLARFAYAKAVSYPDMGDVRNNLTMSIDQYSTSYDEYTVVENGNNVIVKVPNSMSIDEWRGSSGNTYLLPMESDQFDLSLEWYFATSGSLTTTLFYKDLNNFYIQGSMPKEVVNPVYSDEIRTVEVTTTRNGGKGEMYGFELAYQQFFDFLPSPYDGFGVQATYTQIESSGVPHNEESYEDADWADGGENDTGARVNLKNVPLQGQSDETINFTLMYEKYDWQLRAAYNWRSKYLLTTRDVISKYPLWSDDIGMLDASIMYNINDNITIGLQGTNLTNEQTKTLMILNDDGMTAGRSWFVMDRRYTLSLRAKF